MALNVLTQVWEQSEAKGSDLLVLLAIADHADPDDGTAFPGIEHLAEKARVSPRTVKTAVARLVEMGELEIVERGGFRGEKGGRSTLYRILTGTKVQDSPVDHEAKVQNSHLDGKAKVQSTTSEGAGYDKRRCKSRQPLNREPSVEPSVEPSESARATRTRKKRMPDPDSLPEGFPEKLTATVDEVLPGLRRVAEAKGAVPPQRYSVALAVQSFPDHNHLAEAGAFEHYWIFGNGRKKRRRDIVMTFRNWLDNADPALTPRPSGDGSPPALPDRYAKYDATTVTVKV